MLLMMLLWLSAGFPGPHVALWRYFGASLDWSVFAACFAAFLIGEPEARWSLATRWRERQKPSSGEAGCTSHRGFHWRR
jgi:hypothetical protein